MKEKIKIKTLKVRVKDKHASRLRAIARDVNFIWNYCNDLSSRFIQEKRVFLSGYSFHPYMAGSSQYFNVNAGSAGLIACEYAVKRKKAKKTILKWRKSYGSRKSLGWIPFRAADIRWKDGAVRYYGMDFDVWDSYGLSEYKFKAGSFNEDARGRWYFNVAVEVEEKPSTGKGSVGIDLGLKETATCSTGEVLPGREYRKLKDKLATAQRANKKSRVHAIHAKIKNRRKDDIHKFTTKLVANNAAIFVGDVSSKKLIKTRMAKSVHDAGWYMLKTILEYKCDYAGVVFEVVDEMYTTVTCSVCKSRTGPRGLEGLRIREWSCECGVTHDRDVNAARNILATGHGRLAEGRAKAA